MRKASSFNYAAQHVVQFGQGGGNWLPFTAETVIQGQAGSGPASGVTGPTGPYWWDPRALAAMQPGQVLDKDPLTGEQTVVSSMAQGPRGPLVVIDRQITGVIVRSAYEQQSGVLAQYIVQTAHSGTTITLTLQGGP